MLELGVISSAFDFQEKAKFELFEDKETLVSHYEAIPTVLELVKLLQNKFAKAAMVRSSSNSKIVFFDYSNDYIIFLATEEEIKNAFHLTRDQMSAYFEDTIEDYHDKAYLRSIWVKYESFM